MRIMRADSTEILTIALTTPYDVSGDVIDVSFDGGATWHTAPQVPGGVQLLVGPKNSGISVAKGTRAVLVRIWDSPEVPILNAGILQVI